MHVSTIKEYISTFSFEQHEKLDEIYDFIKNIVPDGTSEGISYKMPTFKFNGNLLHFAMYQKHWSLYPGPEAIEYFKILNNL